MKHSVRRSVRKLSGRAAVMIAAAAVAVAGCSAPTGDSAASSSGTVDAGVSIGLLAPLTGASAADGKLMQQGAQLAVDQLNTAGGVVGRQVTLKTVDVKDQSADAVSAAVSELTADSSVVGVLTGYASTTNFEIDLLAEADMPYILGGGSDQTAGIIAKAPDKYPTIWSLAPSYAGYTTDLPARLTAWDKDGTYPLRNKSVYIVSSDNPYSDGIATGLTSTFTTDGWTVTGPDTVPFGDVSDWTTQITKIKAADPSVVINTDYLTANAAKFITQFSQNPTDSLVFSQYAPSVPEFLDLAGAAANGVVYNLPLAALPTTTEGAKVLADFTTAYGSDPGLYGVLLYEEVKLWAAAAVSVGDPTQRAKVGAAIGALDVTTSVGQVSFDATTHLAKSGDDAIPFTGYQIQDGKRVTIYPTQYAQGGLQKPSWLQ